MMNLTRVIATTSIFFISLSLNAGSVGSADHRMIYSVAGSLGIFQANFKTRYTDLSDVIAQNISENYVQQSYAGGIGLGIAKIYSSFFMGLEIWGNFYTGKGGAFEAGANSTAFSDTTFVKSNVDLVFKPGLMLLPDLASYLNIGVSAARVSNQVISPLDFTPLYQTVTENDWLPGVILGIGAKKYLTENWSVFAEYNYRDFGSVAYSHFQNYTATYSHSNHITSNTALIGVAWNL